MSKLLNYLGNNWELTAYILLTTLVTLLVWLVVGLPFFVSLVIGLLSILLGKGLLLLLHVLAD